MGIRIDALNPGLASREHVVAAMKAGSTVGLTVGQMLDLLIDSAPATLDTLNELAAALGDDADFAATVANALATKAEAVQAVVDLASASTTNLAASTSWNVRITGTTTIADFGTAPEGTLRFVRMAGALTITYNATSLILPGLADITTAANDCFIARSLGSGNWIVLIYQKADGQPLVKLGAGVMSTTTLAPSLTITGIVSRAKQVICGFKGLQTVNNTTPVLVQLGTGGALVTTGYAGSAGRVVAAAAASIQPTNGAGIYINANTEIAFGSVTALLIDESTNEWDIDIRAKTSTGIIFSGGAQIALSGPLDRLAFVANSGNLVAGAKINMRQSR